MKTPVQQELAFFITKPHPCSYLEGRAAVTLFADPDVDIDTYQYSVLINYGFRRSGNHIYRPRCPDCSACIPIRIPVNEFRPNRNQRRVLKTNTDISVNEVPAEFQEEHFALYQTYLNTRHAGGGMDNPDRDKYESFLINPSIDVRFLEFRLGEKLIAVAVTDYLASGLSAVYSFFDPAESHRSLGTLTVLRQIELAQRFHMPYVYLGYWIKETHKMSYKSNFRPFEAFIGGQWVNYTT